MITGMEKNSVRQINTPSNVETQGHALAIINNQH